MREFFDWAFSLDSPTWVQIMVLSMCAVFFLCLGVLTVLAVKLGFWPIIAIWIAAPVWLLRRIYLAARKEGGAE